MVTGSDVSSPRPAGVRRIGRRYHRQRNREQLRIRLGHVVVVLVRTRPGTGRCRDVTDGSWAESSGRQRRNSITGREIRVDQRRAGMFEPRLLPGAGRATHRRRGRRTRSPNRRLSRWERRPECSGSGAHLPPRRSPDGDPSGSVAQQDFTAPVGGRPHVTRRPLPVVPDQVCEPVAIDVDHRETIVSRDRRHRRLQERRPAARTPSRHPDSSNCREILRRLRLRPGLCRRRSQPPHCSRWLGRRLVSDGVVEPVAVDIGKSNLGKGDVGGCTASRSEADCRLRREPKAPGLGWVGA